MTAAKSSVSISGGSQTAYLGKIRHVTLGVDFPDLVLPGISKALAKQPVPCALAVSTSRDCAADRIIDAPAGQFNLARGHSGTSVKEALRQAAKLAHEDRTLEIEADQLQIWISRLSHSLRTFGFPGALKINPEELSLSLAYMQEVLEEAVSVGVVNSFSVDTCDIHFQHADSMDKDALEAHFNQLGTPTQRRTLFRHYSEKPFRMKKVVGTGSFSCKFSKEDVMRLSLKFWDAINHTIQIHESIKKQMAGKPFGFEVALGESRKPTTEKELLYFLHELERAHIPVDFVEPNIAIRPYENFSFKVADLQKQLERLAAVARSQGEAALTLSIRGGGKAPGLPFARGFFTAADNATDGLYKFKTKGIYYELILETLSKMPRRSAGYNMYSRIFDSVHRFLKKDLSGNNSLANPILVRMLNKYDKEIRQLKRKPRDPEADFFRRYSKIAMNLRDMRGRRYLRDALLELYTKDKAVREKINTAIESFTLDVFNLMKLK